MVSTLYDEERVSKRISAYGTEVVLRRCLNEVVLNCHHLNCLFLSARACSRGIEVDVTKSSLRLCFDCQRKKNTFSL